MTLPLPVDNTCQGIIAPGSAIPSYTFDMETGEATSYSSGGPLGTIDLGEIEAPTGIVFTSAGSAVSSAHLTLEGEECEGVTVSGTVSGFANHPFNTGMVEEVQSAWTAGELTRLFEASGEYEGPLFTDDYDGNNAHTVVIHKPL